MRPGFFVWTLVLLSAEAFGGKCDRVLTLDDHAVEVRLPLRDKEGIAAGPLITAGHPHLVLGVSAPRGRRFPGGRVMVYDLLSPARTWSQDMPPKPASIEQIALSPDNSRLAASSGQFGDGPATIFDVATGKIEVSKWQKDDPIGQVARILDGLARSATEGDPVAQTLTQEYGLWPLAAKRSMLSEADWWRKLRSFAQRPAVMDLFGVKTTQVNDIGPSGIEYSPDGERYLLKGQSEYSVHDARSHALVAAIDPVFKWRILPPGVPYFLHGGQSVVALHLDEVFSLWDASTGENQDVVKVPYAINQASFARVTALSVEASHIAVPVSNKHGSYTAVFTTEMNSLGKPHLREAERFAAFKDPKALHFPLLAFAPGQRFALSLPGQIQLRRFSPQGSSVIERTFALPENRKVQRLAVDPALTRIAALSGEAPDQSLFIFTSDGRTPSYELKVKNLPFIDRIVLWPRGHEVFLVADLMEGDKLVGSKVYQVDLDTLR